MALKLIGEVALDGSGWDRGLNNLSGSTLSIVGKMVSSVKSQLAGAFAVGAFGMLIREAAESADKIERLNRVYGVSTDTLQKWSYAATITDTGLENIIAAYRKFSAAKLAAGRDPEGEMAKNFGLLGITLKDLEAKRPEQIMYRIAGGMASAAEDSDAFAAALKILGKAADDVLPALKALAGDEIKNAPILSESSIRILASEMEHWKSFKAHLKDLAGEIGARASAIHLNLADLIDDIMGLAGAFVHGREEGKTFRGELARVYGEIKGRKEARNARNFPGDPGMGMQGKFDAGWLFEPTSNLSVDELAEAAQFMRAARELEEKNRISGLTHEQRIIEILSRQAELRKEIAALSYGPEYAEKRLEIARLDEELMRLRGEEKQKAMHRPQLYSDSLVSVGNFLGAGPAAIGGIQQQQLALMQQQLAVLRQIADNTRASGSSGPYFSPT